MVPQLGGAPPATVWAWLVSGCRVAGKGPNVRERRGFRGAAQVPEHRVRASRVAQVRVDRPHRLMPEEGVVPRHHRRRRCPKKESCRRPGLHLDRRLQLRGPAHEGHQAAHCLWRQPVPVRGADADQGSRVHRAAHLQELPGRRPSRRLDDAPHVQEQVRRVRVLQQRWDVQSVDRLRGGSGGEHTSDCHQRSGVQEKAAGAHVSTCCRIAIVGADPEGLHPLRGVRTTARRKSAVLTRMSAPRARVVRPSQSPSRATVTAPACRREITTLRQTAYPDDMQYDCSLKTNRRVAFAGHQIGDHSGSAG